MYFRETKEKSSKTPLILIWESNNLFVYISLEDKFWIILEEKVVLNRNIYVYTYIYINPIKHRYFCNVNSVSLPNCKYKPNSACCVDFCDITMSLNLCFWISGLYGSKLLVTTSWLMSPCGSEVNHAFSSVGRSFLVPHTVFSQDRQIFLCHS